MTRPGPPRPARRSQACAAWRAGRRGRWAFRCRQRARQRHRADDVAPCLTREVALPDQHLKIDIPPTGTFMRRDGPTFRGRLRQPLRQFACLQVATTSPNSACRARASPSRLWSAVRSTSPLRVMRSTGSRSSAARHSTHPIRSHKERTADSIGPLPVPFLAFALPHIGQPQQLPLALRRQRR